MSGNTSATGGTLLPVSGPNYDDALIDQLQPVIRAILGLPGNLVRPRWQATAPSVPAKEVTWCAVGITRIERDANPAKEYIVGVGLKLTRHEHLEIMVSFYGPAAGEYATRLQDGLDITQNREPFFLTDVSYKGASDITKTPDLLGTEWVTRQDITLSLVRRVTRVYEALHLLSAGGTLHADSDIFPLDVETGP